MLERVNAYVENQVRRRCFFLACLSFCVLFFNMRSNNILTGKWRRDKYMILKYWFPTGLLWANELATFERIKDCHGRRGWVLCGGLSQETTDMRAEVLHVVKHKGNSWKVKKSTSSSRNRVYIAAFILLEWSKYLVSILQLRDNSKITWNHDEISYIICA